MSYLLSLTYFSAPLALSSTAHRVLLRQSDGSYTAFEMTNTPPYGVLRTIPNFQKQLTSCMPIATGLYAFTVSAVVPLASGGYLFAISGSTPGVDIAVFDAGLNLISEAPYTGFPPQAIADLNGDGNPDIIGTGYHNGRLAMSVSLGSGGASFLPPVFYSFSDDVPYIIAIVVADLNGDGRPDIVVADASGQSNVSVFYGNGDGTFQAERVVIQSTPEAPPVAVAIADLNGDGKADLVFTTPPYGGGDVNPAVEVAIANGNGTFAAPVVYPVGTAGLVAIGDVNGDGIPDIVTSGIPDIVASGITILFGDGKGGFQNRRDYVAPMTGNLILTDFDGDGITDIVNAVGNPGIMAGDALVEVHGLGQGVFAAPPVSLIPNYSSIDSEFTGLATADVNGDGISDLATVESDGNVTVLTGVGDGSFKSTFQFTFEPGIIPYGALFADFNHDGIPDLAVVGSGYQASSFAEVEVLLGNGDGTFRPPINSPAPFGALAFAAADFNGDGNTDLAVLVSPLAVLASPGPASALGILLGNGDGTFTEGAIYPVGSNAQSLAVGDFNGDGKIDVVVAVPSINTSSPYNGNILLWAGNGDGTFAPPTVMPIPNGGFADGPASITAADLNRDGKLDLAIAFDSGGLVTMLGRGDGTFQAPVGYAVNADSVQVGDVNGDGIPDLVVWGPVLGYMLGNGDGSFDPPVIFGEASGPLALGNFNHDRMLDVASYTSPGIETFLNGTQAAAPVTVVSAASFTPGPLAADSIATAFGSNLAAAASVPIVDSTGTTFQAPVLYDSASQINFVIPAGVDAGPAKITFGGGPAPQSADVVVAPAAPSLFTLNAGGLAAAYVTRVAPGGGLTNELIFKLQNGVYTPVPISVYGEAYLILFGTGIRNAADVSVSFNPAGESAVSPSYAGPQPTFPGLDQVNVLLPPSLAGGGCLNVVLNAGSLVSNAVYFCVQ